MSLAKKGTLGPGCVSVCPNYCHKTNPESANHRSANPPKEIQPSKKKALQYGHVGCTKKTMRNIFVIFWPASLDMVVISKKRIPSSWPSKGDE